MSGHCVVVLHLRLVVQNGLTVVQVTVLQCGERKYTVPISAREVCGF